MQGPLRCRRISVCLADRRLANGFSRCKWRMRPEQLRRLFALLPDGLDFVVERPVSWAETMSYAKHAPIDAAG